MKRQAQINKKREKSRSMKNFFKNRLILLCDRCYTFIK